MLSRLDGGIEWLTVVGWELSTRCASEPYAAAFAGSMVLGVVVALVGSDSHRVVTPLLLSFWAQALVLSDRVLFGTILYGLAFASAFRIGKSTGYDRPSGAASRGDLCAVLGLVLIASALRLYALEEIPWFVDVEPAGAFLESLSPYGLEHYIVHNRVLDDGFIHMLGRWLSVTTVGPSVLALRLVGVGFGVLSVALCYIAARHFVGVGWAFATGLLLATDPAHLFWSRIEASQIVAVTVSAFTTLIIAVRMTHHRSVGAAAAAALWMPITRYFYASGLGLVALPALSLLTTAGRRGLGEIASVVALLLLGGVLWFHSSSLLRWAATGEWQTVATLNVYGRPLFAPHDPRNEFPQLSAVEQIELQGFRFLQNVGKLARHLAYDRDGYSNWLMMAQPDPLHRRSTNAAIILLLIPALGYLLGAGHDSRKGVLLLWLAVLVLPGVFSEDPEPRRVAGFMAAIYLAVIVFISHQCAHAVVWPKLARRILLGAIGIAATGVAAANAASHFLIGREKPAIQSYIEFVAPVFASADVVYHNIEDEAVAGTLVFGNAAVFVRRLPCFRFVDNWLEQWSNITGERRCELTAELYRHLLPAAAVRQRAEQEKVRRVAFLLEVDSPTEIEIYGKLVERFPGATVDRQRLALPPSGARDVVVISPPIDP